MAQQDDENKNNRRVCSICGTPIAITDYDGLCEDCRKKRFL